MFTTDCNSFLRAMWQFSRLIITTPGADSGDGISTATLSVDLPESVEELDINTFDHICIWIAHFVFWLYISVKITEMKFWGSFGIGFKNDDVFFWKSGIALLSILLFTHLVFIFLATTIYFLIRAKKEQ